MYREARGIPFYFLICLYKWKRVHLEEQEHRRNQGVQVQTLNLMTDQQSSSVIISP